jgi:hypothetical protein
MGGQDAPNRPLAILQRQRQPVADVATDELDVGVFRRSVKEAGPQLGQTEALGGGQPVVSVDDHMVRAANKDGWPTPL